MSLLLSLALTGALGAGPGTPTGHVPRTVTVTAEAAALEVLSGRARRIRGTTTRMRTLLAEGARRSPTFAALINDIQGSDVIVYVEATFAMPADVTGRILFSGVAGTHRYMRVQVHSRLPGDHMIAVIAHELQHVREVAAEPTVIDGDSLGTLYKRIGHPALGAARYDTRAAQRTQQLVRRELLG